MDAIPKEYLDKLAIDAESFIDRADDLARRKFGNATADNNPEIITQLALTMAHGYASMLMYDGITRLTQATDLQNRGAS